MRNHLTTVLDLIGMVLLVVAASLLVAQWSTPGAVAVAGAGLIGVSWVVDHQQKGGRR